MDAEIKRKWVEALRSGGHKQSAEFFHDPMRNEYCCLGVLCKIVLRKERYESLFAHTDPHDRGDLIRMNDAGKSFAEIADYIEQHL